MILGLDYASVDENSPPDFHAAKMAGARFAIVRGSYETWVDPVAKRDLPKIRAAGLVAGTYIAIHPGEGHPGPAEQIAAFYRAVAIDPTRDLVPALDIEFPHGIAATGMTRAALAGWIMGAAAAHEHTFGVRPMIYSSGRVLDGSDADSLDIPSLPGVFAQTMSSSPLWLARYPIAEDRPAVYDVRVDGLAHPPVPAAWGDQRNVWIHQYQGDARGFPGFSSTVDLNRFFAMRLGDSGERVRWLQRRIGQAEGTPGQFDRVMDDAVRDFQCKHDLEVDGIVGPATFAAASWVPLEDQ